ncbi:TolC family outer membrane protein [Ruegeria sp. 2205SS24-7]|uniref:TolC family outer membrane protein n=1 Tax=Ruegeria discodermiae TaxID=3064389 RepID=UPI0027426868|nr:TolC family outer membrane protein [Ruegeria sp. 2205SS24-7]MDP5216885.1 TolC family outer membrane protein [Ruegeria sp. 2205SS24-7]
MLRAVLKGTALSVALLAASVVPRSALADNLADALVGAYNTSGLLEQNRALLRAADEDVAIAVAQLRPIINWTMQIQRQLVDQQNNNFSSNNGDTEGFIGLSFQQLLFDGGATRLAKQAAQESVLSARQSLIDVEQSILFRAVSAYMNLILQEDNVALRRNNVRVLGEELRASQDRFEVGEVTRTDVALSEASVAAARANLADALGSLTTAKAEYVNAVGNEPGKTAGQPSLPRLPASIDAAIAVAVRTHPDILAAQHQVRAAELIVQQQRKELGPNVTLDADLGYTEDFSSSDFRNDSSAGVTFRQPVYAGGALAAQVRRAIATRDSTRFALLTAQKDVIQGVKDAYVRFQTAEASLTASNERVRAAQIAFDGIREEATLGARTTLDVLTAEQDLLDAQTQQIFARSERSLAAYQVLLSQGLLTAERLGLAVQIYDPTLYYNLVKNAPARVSKQSKDLDRVLKALGRQ